MSAYNPRKGHVYLFRCGQYFKIGQTQVDVEQRRKAVQHGNPHEVVLVHVIPSENAFSAEKFLHLKFASKRVRLEWFELSEEEVKWICKIKSISQTYLDRYNLWLHKPPAKDTATTKVCDYCRGSFVLEKSRAARQRYCSITCTDRAAREKAKERYAPRPTMPRLISYTSCIICGKHLPRGFGPCCSSECALSKTNKT